MINSATWQCFLWMAALTCLGAFAPVYALTYSFSTLQDFAFSATGAMPSGDLLFSNGSLYGTAESGGANGDGTVFALNLATAAMTAASFTGSNGNTPSAGLTLFNSNLYGTTVNGGDSNDDGVVFVYNPTSNSITGSTNFTGANGSTPSAGLTVFNNLLYSTTFTGGDAANDGTIFKYNSSSGAITSTNLTSATTGASSQGSLTLDGSLLYGTASTGGASGDGAIFAYNPTTNTVNTPSVSFTGANGNAPEAGLTLFNNKLYGTTTFGGNTSLNNGLGFGTVFQYDPTTQTITTLVTFSGSNGSLPTSDLVFDGSGNLYGTTSQGGSTFVSGTSDGFGTAFEYNLTSKVLTTLVNFDGAAGGANPQAGVTFDSSGNLYGTTSAGGDANGDGTIYKLTAAPEPSQTATLALCLAGLTFLLLRARRRTQH